MSYQLFAFFSQSKITQINLFSQFISPSEKHITPSG